MPIGDADWLKLTPEAALELFSMMREGFGDRITAEARLSDLTVFPPIREGDQAGLAGQADDALDVVGAVEALALVAGILEHRDVAALRRVAEHPAREEAHRKREGVLAVAVRVLRDEQIVADQQGRDHRAGRDVERLDREGTDHHGNQHGIDDRAHGFAPAACLVLSPLPTLSHVCHRHASLNEPRV